jgi:hypothetical protein
VRVLQLAETTLSKKKKEVKKATKAKRAADIRVIKENSNSNNNSGNNNWFHIVTDNLNRFASVTSHLSRGACGRYCGARMATPSPPTTSA